MSKTLTLLITRGVMNEAIGEKAFALGPRTRSVTVQLTDPDMSRLVPCLTLRRDALTRTLTFASDLP